MIPRTAAAAAALAALAIARAAVAAPTPSPTPIAAPAPGASATPMALTLAQAEDIALASSPALALARGQLNAAQGGIGFARAGALPDLAGSASSSRSKSVSPAGSFAPGFPANATSERSFAWTPAWSRQNFTAPSGNAMV